jgi:cell shape-determining protein MreD
MKWANPLLILFGTLLAVFWESAFQGIRNLLGAQVDLLPAIMVYASLTASLLTVSMAALLGGLWFDSLSANPLGITVIPLLVCGLAFYSIRELLLREQTFAQIVLGLIASLVTPFLVLVILLTTGKQPLVGWGTFWQLIVMGAGGAVATPVCFALFGFLNRFLGYEEVAQLSFRPDREIRRGRS